MLDYLRCPATIKVKVKTLRGNPLRGSPRLGNPLPQPSSPEQVTSRRREPKYMEGCDCP